MSDTRDSSLGGSSLVHTAQPSSFDLRRESDVIALLKLVHQNPIDLDIKNHLRDLIFAFRQSMQEEDLEKVRQGFLPLGIAIKSGLEAKVPDSAKEPSVKKPAWGVRPSPRFVTGKLKQDAASTTPFIKVPPVAPRVEEIAAVQPVQQAQPASVAAKEESIAVPPKLEPEAVAPAVESSVPTPQPVVYQDYGERIKEIKRIVNEKVGNPVNLIDSHNEIGREYMNALLDAMKKTSGGGVGGASEAMDRLEKAFKEVREVVLNKETPVTLPAEEKPVPEAAPAMPKQPVIEEVVTPQVAQHQETLSSVAESVPEEVPAAQNIAEPEEKEEVVAFAQKPVAPVRRSSVKERLQENPPQADPAAEGRLHSVAKDKQLQDLLRANRQQEAMTFKQQEDARIAAMDPLQAPDVTSGLAQLLSEWSLFKSSGIFGTGPSGKDHPLYVKIAPLTMAAVIAGRFEGATTPIKQSITDYMNGWRYEEGITHEHGETFEHYLRRVVRHILNKQNRVK
jgi:hypothetical protein